MTNSKGRVGYRSGVGITAQCNQCAELISIEANICPYCQSQQPPTEERAGRIAKDLNKGLKWGLSLAFGIIAIGFMLFYMAYRWLMSQS